MSRAKLYNLIVRCVRLLAMYFSPLVVFLLSLYFLPSSGLSSTSKPSHSFLSHRHLLKPIATSTNLILSAGNIFENEPGDIVPENAVEIGILGTISNLVCFYSLYILKTTSCGLPPGPLGLEGAMEGISYLVVIGIFGWSILKKIQTGSGLNTDKYGLLGLAEGLSFLTIIGGIAIAFLNLQEYGFLPGFLPNDNCYGVND